MIKIKQFLTKWILKMKTPHLHRTNEVFYDFMSYRQNAFLSQCIAITMAKIRSGQSPYFTLPAEKIAKEYRVTSQTAYNWVSDLIKQGFLMRFKGSDIGEKNAKNNYFCITEKTIKLLEMEVNEFFYSILDLIKKTANEMRDFFKKKREKTIKYNAEKPKTLAQRIKELRAILAQKNSETETQSKQDTPQTAQTTEKNAINGDFNAIDSQNNGEQYPPIIDEQTAYNANFDGLNSEPQTADGGRRTADAPRITPLYEIPKKGYFLTNENNIIKKFYEDLYLLKKDENYKAERRISGDNVRKTLNAIKNGKIKKLSDDELNKIISNAKNNKNNNEIKQTEQKGNNSLFEKIFNRILQSDTTGRGKEILKQSLKKPQLKGG